MVTVKENVPVLTKLVDGTYRAKVLKQYIITTKDGNPELVLSVQPIDKLNNGFNLGDGVVELADELKQPRSVNVRFPSTDSSWAAQSAEILMGYGWEPNENDDNPLATFAEDAPAGEQFSLVGSIVAVWIRWKPDTKNPDVLRDRWSLVKMPEDTKVGYGELKQRGAEAGSFLRDAIARAREKAPF